MYIRNLISVGSSTDPQKIKKAAGPKNRMQGIRRAAFPWLTGIKGRFFSALKDIEKQI